MTIPVASRVIRTLRDLAREPAVREHCEMCGDGLAAAHPHLVNPKEHALKCACGACALLFSMPNGAAWKRVESRSERIAGFNLTDAEWESLSIPINLAFFFRSSVSGRVTAFYPGPAGMTECLLPLEGWAALVASHPILGDLQEDVEALLVNRVNFTRDHYRTSIDHCYRLAGLIRLHWKGLTGGTAVWAEVSSFFLELSA